MKYHDKNMLATLGDSVRGFKDYPSRYRGLQIVSLEISAREIKNAKT